MEKLKTKNKKALVTNQAQHHNPLLQTQSQPQPHEPNPLVRGLTLSWLFIYLLLI